MLKIAEPTYVPRHLKQRPYREPQAARWRHRIVVGLSLSVAVAAGVGFSEWVGSMSGSPAGTEAVTTGDDGAGPTPVTTRPTPATTALPPPTTAALAATSTPAPPSAATYGEVQPAAGP